jgi:MoaA/NifB/PqqE/SkfB family radical SAM enzyme
MVFLEPQNGWRVVVDQDGQLILAPEAATNPGLVPGTELLLKNTAHGMILHGAATQPEKIYIEPTTHCNLNCHICIRDTWNEKQGHMSRETFDHLMDSLARLDYRPDIVFGGFGEPLSHPNIVNMIERAKTTARRVQVITNGLLLTAGMIREFIRLGLDILWFSADGFHVHSNDHPSDLLPKLEALNSLRFSLGGSLPETGLVFVATRTNIGEFPALLQSTAHCNVSRYMVTNLLPYSAELCEQTLYGETLEQQTGTSPVTSPLVQLPRMDGNRDILLLLHRTLAATSNVSINQAGLSMPERRCPFIEAGSVSVSWTGSVSPCLALMHDHTSYFKKRPRLVRCHILGNVNEITLSEIWNDAGYLAFRRRVQAFEFSPCISCGGCSWSEKNEEDCFANSFPTCGGCLWSLGVIQCP